MSKFNLYIFQWRWTFLLFAMSFLSSWTAFAAIWVISYTHGDLEVEHLQEGSGALIVFKMMSTNVNFEREIVI